MFDVLSRETLAALTRAVNEVAPSAVLGLARPIGETDTEVLYADRWSLGSYRVAMSEVPDALAATGDGAIVSDVPSNLAPVVAWHLDLLGARQLVSLPVPNQAVPTRLWVGLATVATDPDGLVRALTSAAVHAADALDRGSAGTDLAARQRRLEMTAGLLPALTEALDIRDVFERLSAISQQALPHDMLTLGVNSDDLATLTMYARTGTGPDLGGTFPQPYPAAVVQARAFDVVDDRLLHPLERDRPPTRLGCRSAVRVQIQLGGRAVAGLAFNSFQVAAYGPDDVAIARRLGDYVAVMLAHQRLAEQARQHETLRVRNANLELLDELLATLVDTGDLQHVFARISAIAQRVLPHDAAALPVILPDGRRARIHASLGFDPPLPDIVDVPEPMQRNPEWESEIVPRLSARSEPNHVRAARMGFESLLRVPVRLEGRFAGTVLFASRTPAAYSPPDILIARRIADRLALLLARDREVAADRRADEAAARASRLEARVRLLTDELDARTGYRRVIGESEQWRSVLTQATQVAPNETTVLILGESGTGKEVVARFVHRASPRAHGPFVALNCAALPEQLLEAELFGYERGAFTGAVQSKPGQLEQAAGGTLFLDEIGEMSLPAQAKFLRVLQEREFQRLGGTRVLRADARIVAATNRDLPKAIAQNQFREDLFYRLNVFAIFLPPLRERPRDVLPLSDAFLAEIGKGMGRPAAGISKDARDRLLAYHWPGNVRELRNILERASILCDGGLITPEHLAIGAGAPPAPARLLPSDPRPAEAMPAAEAPPPPAPAGGDLQSMERERIEEVIREVRFNKSKAAKILGITRQQLYLRLKKYGLE